MTAYSAAKTALLLDNTQLGPSQVQVSSAAGLGDLAASAPHAASGSHESDEIAQEDKPRSRIVAEYLAHGYALSDQAITQAIALDNKHGISSRFTSALSSFDQKYKASETAKQMDVKYGVTDKAKTGWLGINSYFEKALGTPTGQKLHKFYTDSNKQVQDIHTEARRLADLKSGKPSNAPATASGSIETGEKAPASGSADQAVATTSSVAPTSEKQ